MQINKEQLFAIARQVFADEMDGLNQVLSNIDDNFIGAVKTILACKGKVVVMGMGKSGHVANKMAATFASTGTPAFFVHPAEAMHGDLGMVDTRDVVIAVSYSGNSDELDVILPLLKRSHVPIIALTGNLDSNLAKLGSYALNIKVDREACPLDLAPTTSTTVTLAMGDALAICLLTLRGFQPEDFALSHPGGSLGRRLLTRVKDIMHSADKLPKVFETDNVRQVVLEITNKRLGLAGVLSPDNQVSGVITDGDLRRFLERFSPDLDKTSAGQIMSKHPKVLHKDVLAVEAINLMEKYKITGFLVVDDNKQLVGAFNLHDLFKAKLM